MCTKTRWFLRANVILAAVFILAGCAPEKPAPEVLRLSGKIDKIERASDETGKVTVVYYSEKQQQEIAGTGQVTKETEIMINGAIARLKDLREGDQVTGEVRVEKAGKDRRQIALKIHVDRPQPTGG